MHTSEPQEVIAKVETLLEVLRYAAAIPNVDGTEDDDARQQLARIADTEEFSGSVALGKATVSIVVKVEGA